MEIWKSIYNFSEMHIQHQTGILLTITDNRIDMHARDTDTEKKKKYTPSLPSIPTVTAKKTAPTLCQYKPRHYLQNFHLDKSKYRQSESCNTSKIYCNY